MIKPLEEVEREAILEALACTQGNRTHAAAELGISIRTLRIKINKYREDGHFIPSHERVRSSERAGYEYE